MDRANLRDLRRLAPAGAAPELFLGDAELPDPYYGDDAAFEEVIALARSGIADWITRLRD
jgi:protein-tyrosine phosphatase